MFSELFIWFFLVFLTQGAASQEAQRPLKQTVLSFNLRAEYHGLNGFRTPNEQIEQLDPKSTPTWSLQARPTIVHRPRSQPDLERARARSLYNSESEKVEWGTMEILGPDIEDRHTLAQLARMTGNAYALPGKKNWYDIDPAWNNVSLFLFSPSDASYLDPSADYIVHRALHLDGKAVKMVSEAMFLHLKTIPPLFFPSKERPCRYFTPLARSHCQIHSS